MSDQPSDGRRGSVARVSGPLVEVEGLDAVNRGDVIEVGKAPALGEIVSIHEQVATAQMYEYTGGVEAGTTVAAEDRPLAVPLGPGLLGGIFDGLLRPLPSGPDFLGTGWGRPSLGEERKWSFTPGVQNGQDVGPGTVFGTVQETETIEHRLLVPPGVEGSVQNVVAAGDYEGGDALAVVDDRPLTLVQWWPVRTARPVGRRLPGDVPLVTGQRVVDLLFPVARGSTAAVPGGFGTGKTMLLQQIAKWCDARVIVYVGCGERGNEMADLLEDFPKLQDPRTGRPLLERTVIVVNTSNMPIMAREASIYTGITVAEYYRDMGYDSVVIADSTSRWAQALREFATRMGELPAEEGYPAGLASALAQFYERAGRVRTLGGEEASATIIGAVSPPGGDKTEPVTSHTQRFVRCYWSLDQNLAAARHYPAVGWHDSFSRDARTLSAWHVDQGDAEWPRRRARLMTLLSEADELESMVQLVGRQALPDEERVTLIAARLIREGILQQNALNEADAYSSPEKNRALVEAVLAVYDRARDLVESGVPASVVEETDLSPLLRVREQAEAGDVDAIQAARDQVLESLRKPA